MNGGPPIGRFLDGVDASAGPGALLGVPEHGSSVEEVRAALRERLARVDRHPQGRSAEADEVRLALHVAAAQLADTMPERGVDQPADAERPREPIEPGQRVDPRRRTLLAVVAHSGGWNATARHRVGAVAHAMGLSLDEALRLVTQSPAAVAHTRSAPTPWRPATAGAPGHERLGRTPLARMLLGAAALCAAASLVLAVTILWIVSQSGDGSSPGGGAPNPNGNATNAGARSPGGTTTVPSPSAMTAAAPTPALDTDGLVRAFEQVGDDASAFRKAYDVAREAWVDLEPDALERGAYAAADAIASMGAARQQSIGLVTEDLESSESPEASVFAAAVLGRAQAFRALEDTDAGRTATALLERLPTLGPGPDNPLRTAAGRRVVGLGLDDAVTPGRWRRVASAFVAGAPDAGRVALAAVIDGILRSENGMTARRASVLEIAAAVRPWTIEDAELLEAWWTDREVGADGLAVLSSRLAEAGVLGLERSAVLRDDATPPDRAAAWRAAAIAMGLEAPDDGLAPFAQRWREAFDDVRIGDGSGMPDERLAIRSAGLSMLSAALAARWAGETARAELLIDEADTVGTAEADASGASGAVARVAMGDGGGDLDVTRLTGPTRPPDGEWAARYLSARNNEERRLTLLGELRAQSEMHGPADADVLSYAAMVGANRGVRRAAQNAVRAFADDPFVVNGLLEAVHAAARQPDVDDVLTYVTGKRLPSSDSREWRAAARRALAERLAELVTEASAPRIVRAEEAMTRAYLVRLRSVAMEAPSRAQELDAGAEDADDDPLVVTLRGVGSGRARAVRTTGELSDALWEAWRDRARGVPEGAWAPRPLASIERRRSARSGYGSGALQRLALSQLGLVEIMGYLIAAERPERSDDIERLVRRTERAWREADRSLVQVAIAEEAMARLWAIRAGIELEEPGEAS